mgnify:CR=1 FL=1
MSADRDYSMSLDTLRHEACCAYFASDRVPALRRLEPSAAMGGLWLAINSEIESELRRVESGALRLTAPLPRIHRLGWFESLHAIRALQDVRVLALPDGSTALGLYDEATRVFDRRKRWLHRLVQLYGGGSVRGVGNIRFHLELDVFEGLLGRPLRLEDVAIDLGGDAA